MKIKNPLTKYRANALYVSRAFTLLEGFDNDTDYAVLGGWADYLSFHIDYAVELAVSSNAQVGELTIMTDGATAWVEAHEYDNEISGLTFTADISGGNVRLVFTKAGVGENTKLYYRVSRSSISSSDQTLPYTQWTGTHADQDIYVNAVTGNDTTGDGTVGAPYASITKAYEGVPRQLNHAIHIHIAAGTYTDWPTVIDHTAGPKGFVSFDGTGALQTTDGPFTIDVAGITPIQAWNVFEAPIVGGGMVDNEHQGKFVRFLSGAPQGEIAAVVSNTTTAIRIHGYASPAAGDTFELIEPGVSVVSTANKCVVSGHTNQLPPYIFLFGIDFTIPGEGLIIDRAAAEFIGSRFNCGLQVSSSFIGVGMYWVEEPEKSIDDLDLIANFAGVWIAQGKYNFEVWGDCLLYRFVTNNRLLDAFHLNGEIGYSALYTVNEEFGYYYCVDIAAHSSMVRLDQLYLHGRSTRAAVRMYRGAGLFMYDCHVEQGLYGAWIGPGVAYAEFKNFTGTNANVQNALYMTQGARASVEISGTTLVGSGGAGSAIKWASGAADSPYPAANAFVTDTITDAKVIGH